MLWVSIRVRAPSRAAARAACPHRGSAGLLSPEGSAILAREAAREIEKALEQRENEITEGIRLIISKAQDRHLKEPGGETIRRQLTTYINTVFGADPDGEHRVEKLLISRFDGFPAD